ncbi:ester cyclase [Microbacterium sp. 3J1]|uniref:ester cyclase n=1 Tax=Microbacterium sp. 3J1 TaxID=861269 RepID=UPI000A6BC477|nr:ester cyclase [Microbacterium sp. 3J1]
MEPWELREWHADFIDACNRHDLNAVREFVAPAVRRAHLPGGVDAWISDFADLFHAFPDWQWKRIRLVIEDDRLAAHLRGGGTHLSDFRGMAATRRRVNVAEFSMSRVEHGRIIEYTSSDTESLIRSQLGS